MKRPVFIVAIIFIFLPLLFPGLVHADAQADYEYQYSQYRASYTEFSQLKRDYLTNGTLDNQQKAIITAKQALQARDLAKAAYARYLADIITSQNTGYTDFQPVLDRLSQAIDFYNTQAQKSQAITSPKELLDFSDQYAKDTIVPDRSFFYGQVIAKLAQLVRFQLDANNTLNSIYPNFPTPMPLPLKTRLEDIPSQADNINHQISALASSVIPKAEDNPLQVDQYFIKPVKSLLAIRSLQETMINQLIDIDINYAQQ